MRQRMIVFLVVLSTVSSELSIKYLEDIISIIDKSFIDGAITAFFSNDKTLKTKTLLPNLDLSAAETVIKAIMKNGNRSFTNIDENVPIVSEMKQPKNPKVLNILVVLEEMRALGAVLAVIKQNRVYNFKSKILVLCVECREEDVTVVLRGFWQRVRVLSATVLTVDNKKPQIFTWYPYDSDPEPIKLQIFDELFPKKIPTDFKGHQIVAAVQPTKPYIFPATSPGDYKEGLEITLLTIMSQKRNFTVKYKEADVGESPRVVFSKNLETHGLFKHIYRYTADLAFGGLINFPQRTQASEVLFAHTQDKLLWTFPVPSAVVTFTSLFRAFALATWLFIGAGIICNATTITLLGRFHREGSSFTHFWRSLLSAWGITVDAPLPRRPKSSLLKTFVLIALYYSIIISCCYKSCLVTFLTKPLPDEPIKSTYEALDRGFCIQLRTSSTQAMKKGDSYWDHLLVPGRHFFSMNATYNLEQVAINRNCVNLVTFYESQYLHSRYFLRDDGKQSIQYFEESYNAFSTAMFMGPGHPLEDMFNKMTVSLVENGIVEHLLKNIMWRVKQTAMFLRAGRRGMAKPGHKPLTLAQLDIVFYALCIVLCIISVFFLLEHVVFWKSKTKRNFTGMKGKMRNFLKGHDQLSTME